ncbi:hypothetical protein CA13_12930 [Planctomycetes bacterium CA13]|uniref:Methyltransferase domain-containing protein n=1 Tax=Novipirellula herctigrandis TaxID=2527986 RepID=A0A5C5YYV8_9BACT|nr:hypothetical protein CA13_12930 [Planctomycetes bacterium CA13]
MRFVFLAKLALLFALTSANVLAQDTAVTDAAVTDAAVTDAAVNTTVDVSDPKSVSPNINRRFLDPQMDVQEWVERFEVESREVYHARDAILRGLNLKPGERVADIGAGTGFYSLLMADAVGPKGWTFAVEISPKFVAYLSGMFEGRDVNNVTTVMCDENSICLPPNSIDAAFICDVYHHFEYPAETMTSMFHALESGGRVAVVDFERVAGLSSEWTMGHVRAGKQTVIDEIQAVGFEFVAERDIPGFKDNYYIEFRKP